jgi:hypothetical protein
MRILARSFALLLSCLIMLPMVSQGQDQPNNTPKVTKQDPTSQDYAALAQLNEAYGKIANLDLKAGTMTLTIETAQQDPKNPQANALQQQLTQVQQQRLALEYQKYQMARNANAKQQALLRYQTLQQQMLSTAALNMKMSLISKDYDLDVMDTLRVARKDVAAKYDDEGELIKYKPSELEKMKSKDVPGGYTATPDDLQVGQKVKLFLSPPKKKDAKSSEASADANTDKSKSDGGDGKSKQNASSQANHTQVRMAMILEDAPPPPDADNTKKKKKNK